MKIIFLTNIPFMKQHITDLYVKAIEKEYPIEKWDLSGIYNMECEPDDLVDDVKKMSDFTEFSDNLKRVTKEGEVILITNILKQVLVKVAYLFKRYNVLTISITKESQSAWIRHRTYKDFSEGMDWRNKLKAIPANNEAIKRIYHCIKYKNVMFDYILASGNYQPELCKNFNQIHHVKYDEYLQALHSASIIDRDYILFLDSAFSDHPSYKGKINSLSHGEYIKDLNFFFNKVEEYFDLPVVISAHPKAHYKISDFNGRMIVKYKTPELIQYAKCIVAHQTTSLINAILLYKPIYIIYNERIMRSFVSDVMRYGFEYAKLIGADIINMDDECLKFNNIINRKKYEWFIQNHILNVEKQELSNAEIILEFLQTRFK